MKNRLYQALLATSLTALLAVPSVSLAESITLAGKTYNLNNTADVMAIMADSRLVRSLKNAPAPIRHAYTQTLRNNVYQKADEAVLQKLQQDAALKGKPLYVHEFRTPGADPAGINADRDLRVLVEREPGIWSEVDRRLWEDTYYTEFSKQTGHQPANAQEARKVASRYRQLATDKSHQEASLDYSDQHLHTTPEGLIVRGVRQARDPKTGKLLYDSDGKTPILEADNQVSIVKAATMSQSAKLHDAEGLSRMYAEKSHEQFRAFEDVQAKLQKAELKPEEISRLRDQAKMHLSESAVQTRKGVVSLEALRNAYHGQGYDVGRLPQRLEDGMALVKGITGDLNMDVDAFSQALQQLGFQSLYDFNRQLQGQMESLKLASKPKPSITPVSTRLETPTSTLSRSLGVAGALVDAYSYLESAEQIRREAEAGKHLYLSLDQDDSELEKNAKVYGFALIEATGIPGAMDTGFEADLKEKDRIEAAIRRGEPVNAVESTARVITDVLYNNAKKTLWDPLEQVGEKAYDALTFVGARWHERQVAATVAADKALQDERRYEANLRANTFGLGSLSMHYNHADGDLVVSSVPDNSALYFKVPRGENWTERYRIQWQIGPQGEALSPAPSKQVLATQPDAHEFNVLVKDYPAGEYTVSIAVFDTESGQQVDRESKTFAVGTATAQLGLGTFQATHGGRAALTTYTPHEGLFFRVAPLGQWNNNITVEWSVNGDTYKTATATEKGANQLALSAPDAPSIKVGVRLLDKHTGKILAYRDQTYPRKGNTPAVSVTSTSKPKKNFVPPKATQPVQSDKTIKPAKTPPAQAAPSPTVPKTTAANSIPKRDLSDETRRQMAQRWQRALACYKSDWQQRLDSQPYGKYKQRFDFLKEQQDRIKQTMQAQGPSLRQRAKAGDKGAVAIYNELVSSHNAKVKEIRALVAEMEPYTAPAYALLQERNTFNQAMQSNDLAISYNVVSKTPCAAQHQINTPEFMQIMRIAATQSNLEQQKLSQAAEDENQKEDENGKKSASCPITPKICSYVDLSSNSKTITCHELQQAIRYPKSEFGSEECKARLAGKLALSYMAEYFADLTPGPHSFSPDGADSHPDYAPLRRQKWREFLNRANSPAEQAFWGSRASIVNERGLAAIDTSDLKRQAIDLYRQIRYQTFKKLWQEKGDDYKRREGLLYTCRASAREPQWKDFLLEEGIPHTLGKAGWVDCNASAGMWK